MNHAKLKKIVFRYLHYLLMGTISVIMVLPFSWTLATSMRKANNSFTLPPAIFPTIWDGENYRRVFEELKICKYMANSLIVTLGSLVIMVLFTSMAAYAFSRIEFKGRNVLFPVLLAGLMIPSQSIAIPVFLIIRQMKLIDNLFSLILTLVYYPLGLFMLRQAMMSIPKSYDEAAYCDGAGHIAIYARIILPMTKSTIMMMVVMHFIRAWNDFFNPLLFINSNAKMTVPLGIRMLNTSNGKSNMPLMMAAVMVSLIVPLLVYIFGQKYLTQGTMLTGLKS